MSAQSLLTRLEALDPTLMLISQLYWHQTLDCSTCSLAKTGKRLSPGRASRNCSLICLMKLSKLSLISMNIMKEEFRKFLLKRTKIPPSQKAKMLKRVKTIWPAKARGISFPSFKNFFLVLASGTELERGLFFLDVENIGVDLDEFRNVAKWVSKSELSDHIAEVVFVLLDDQGQGRIFKENLGPLLFDWRQPRGFDRSAIHVQMGNLKI